MSGPLGGLRERQKVATIRWDGDPDTWTDACQEAYDAIRVAIGDRLVEQITSIEPYGQVAGAFRWRTYGHTDRAGSRIVMAEIERVPGWLDLDHIVELVRAQDVHAQCDMTGGGVATIYAGDPTTVHDPTCNSQDSRVDPGDEARVCNCQTYSRWPAAAGPGTYRWSADSASCGHLLDFTVGPDDDGESSYVSPAQLGAKNEADVAKLIAAQARKPYGVPLTFDDIEAVGLDGTGRSTHWWLAEQNERNTVYCAASNIQNRAGIDAGLPAERRRAENETAGQRAVEQWEKRRGLRR